MDCRHIRGRQRSAGNALTDQRLSRVLAFMEHNFAHNMTLQTLASEAGISLFHFTRLFKAKVGVTPHRHVVMLRMQHARSLLRRTDLTIAEVALEAGYAHLGHFAAAFKREFGLLPNAFRRQGRAQPRAPAIAQFSDEKEQVSEIGNLQDQL